MSFQSRDEFINAQASEKITLVHLHATGRLINWTADGGGVYSKASEYMVTGVKMGDSVLTYTSNTVPTAGEFTYITSTKTVVIYNPAGQDPVTEKMIATYRLLLSDAPVNTAWNLESTNAIVPYKAIIKSSPGYKQKVGVDQNLTSLVGKGKLKLTNDGTFDDIYDNFYFENQQVSVYSWNRQLDISEAQIIFKGKVTNKSYASDAVTFDIRDNIFDLNQNLPQDLYTTADNVSDDIVGSVKRWVYGRVDGLKVQSIDQIGEGYDLTGTVATVGGSTAVTGTGTLFLSETSPGDDITIDTTTFAIDAVNSDTSITLGEESNFTTTLVTASLKPEVPTTVKNREFLVADHVCSELTKTVVEIKQLNRVELSNIYGLEVGNLIEFESGERLYIKSFTGTSVVVLSSNLTTLPSISSDVVRRPISKAISNGNDLLDNDFSITNAGQLKITLSSDAEFNVTRTRSLSNSFTFTNSSRTITYTGDNLQDIITSRDWIRPVSTSTFFEILEVSETTITLRVAFSGATVTSTGQYRAPDYIGDDSIVSVNTIGKTADGTPDGEWLDNAPRIINDILTEVGITNIDTASFTTGLHKSPSEMSIVIPAEPGQSFTTAKEIIDIVNNSTLSTITVDRDLNVKYNSMLVSIPDAVPIISDRDVIKWSVKSVSGKIYQSATVKYNNKDVNNITLEKSNDIVRFESDFVRQYIGTTRNNEVETLLYSEADANTRAHREIYFNRLSKTEVTLNGDLRLDVYEVGDVINIDIERLYKRLGDSTSNQKIMAVVGKTVTGSSVVLIMNDVSNMYNSSSIIAPNTASDYASATSEEKIKYGYITDAQGIVDDDDESANLDLIS